MKTSWTMLIAAAGLLAACELVRAGDAEIIVAARAGDVSKIETLAGASGAGLAVRDSQGRTALLAAAGALRPEAVASLIGLHADVNTKDARGMTALSLAVAAPAVGKEVERDRALVVEALLKAGADSAATDTDGMTALHFAALRGRSELLALLPMDSSTARTKDKAGRTALHYAAMGNHTRLMDALVRAGAEVNSTDRLGETALHTAARRFRSEAATFLIGHGATVDVRNRQGQTPLLLLSMESDDSPEVDAALVKMADVLIGAGANVSAKDAAGMTPVKAAEQGEHPKLAEQLRKHGGVS